VGRGEGAAGAARRAALAACAAAALAVAAGCGGSGADKAGGQSAAQPLRLTLANLDSDPTNFDSQDFVAAVARLSGGSIQIETTYGWRSNAPLGRAERGTIEDVRRARSASPSSPRAPGTWSE
jgi:hypothetical protein